MSASVFCGNHKLSDFSINCKHFHVPHIHHHTGEVEMEGSSLSPPLTAFFILFFRFSACMSSSSAAHTNTDYIKTSCLATTYPHLCYDSLSIYANKIQTSPKRLATTALSVASSSARSTLVSMKQLSKTHGLKPREASAMIDCVEEVADSVDELHKSIEEMGHAGGPDFEFRMSNIQTWVSAALTDEETCTDGFAGRAMNGNLKKTVQRHINKLARLTSNALALVNKYASTHTPASP